MAAYWKWKCEDCGHEFVLTLARMPEQCHRCGGQWFRKVGEGESKEELRGA
jgi:DNA-directed RNA polymerase subunit RPC12/RpoP